MARPKLEDSDKLISIPLRFTGRQVARLQRISSQDGLGVPDHARRALDLYCDHIEQQWQLPPLPWGAQPTYVEAKQKAPQGVPAAQGTLPNGMAPSPGQIAEATRQVVHTPSTPMAPQLPPGGFPSFGQTPGMHPLPEPNQAPAFPPQQAPAQAIPLSPVTVMPQPEQAPAFPPQQVPAFPPASAVAPGYAPPQAPPGYVGAPPGWPPQAQAQPAQAPQAQPTQQANPGIVQGWPPQQVPQQAQPTQAPPAFPQQAPAAPPQAPTSDLDAALAAAGIR